MPGYTLNIAIDEASLKEIQAANELVVITKQVGGQNSGVAWLAFSPWPSNTVSWQDNYAVYASTSQVQQGAVINQSSTTVASPATAYNFAGEVFTACTPQSPLAPGMYEVINNDSDGSLTFGLAQVASINSKTTGFTPIFAQNVLQGQHSDMTPYDTIQVYLAANVSNGMVVATTTSGSCPVAFGGSATNQTITFNSATGAFQITSTTPPPLRRPAASAIA